MYTANGDLRGLSRRGGMQPSGIDGSWTTGDGETVCTSWRATTVTFPKRCQFWFRLGDAYFVSDSDSDRSMLVLRRVVTR